MIIKEALSWADKKLKSKSLSPALDAEVLLSHALKKSKEFLFANPDFELSKLQATSYKLLVRRRANHWPIAYLTGHKAFYGLDFKVTPDVLIPRPETELLVERALQILQATTYPPDIARRKSLRAGKLQAIIDIGTGSGAIIIAIAKKLAEYSGIVQNTPHLYATDISKQALKVAKQNAKKHKVAERIRFEHCNLIENCKLEIENSLVLANLPYLAPGQVSSNPDLKHEPRSALVAGPDGLKHYRNLFKQIEAICHSEGTPDVSSVAFRLRQSASSRRRVAKEEESQRSFVGVPPQDDNKFVLLLEHDPSQKKKLESLTQKYFPKSKIRFHKDLSRRDRVMEVEMNIAGQ